MAGRVRCAALGVVCLAALAGHPAVASAEGPPVISSVSYITSCPYARVGPGTAIATITLDAPAQGATEVIVTSSDMNVATTANTTITNGETSGQISVTPLNPGQTTLTAQLGPQTVALTPALTVGSAMQVAGLADLLLDPATVSPGQSSIGTVVLDFLSPPAGSTVSLASDNPNVHVPLTVPIPADQCRTTFPVTSDSDAAGTADISATLDAVTEHVLLSITPPIVSPPPTPAVPAAAGPTGRRAAALKKCAKVKNKAKKRKCRKRARRLPV